VGEGYNRAMTNISQALPSSTGEQGPLILLVTSRNKELHPFTRALQREIEIRLVTTGAPEDALTIVAKKSPILVIVDEVVNQTSGLSLVQKMVEANAFINTAVISEAAEEDFHIQSEGLGILTKLGKIPGENDAKNLIALLKQVQPGLS
jgi:PleD family two-component response regulator